MRNEHHRQVDVRRPFQTHSNAHNRNRASIEQPSKEPPVDVTITSI